MNPQALEAPTPLTPAPLANPPAFPAASQRRRNEAAGRAFRSAYERLSPGERSGLRQGDPFTQAAFWSCVAAAKTLAGIAAGSTSEATLERVLAFMVPLLSLKTSNNNGQNLGALIRDKGGALSPRRIETIFSEPDTATLCEHIESVATIAKLSIDFGVLLDDLITFQFKPIDVRRRWSRSLFVGMEPVAVNEVQIT